MKVLGVIPARMASSRFYGKPLAQILGKPMIEWVYRQAQKASSLQQVVVATDHQEIHDAVVNFGGQALMTKDSHISGLDRICEVMQKMHGFSHYVNIQGDEPTIDPQTIDGIVTLFDKYSNCQISTAAVLFQNQHDMEDENQVKVVFDKNNRALYFSRSKIPFVRNSQYQPQKFYKHQGIYAYSKETLTLIERLPPCDLEMLESLEQLRFLYHGFSIYVYESRQDSIGVDRPEDILKVESILGKNPPA